MHFMQVIRENCTKLQPAKYGDSSRKRSLLFDSAKLAVLAIVMTAAAASAAQANFLGISSQPANVGDAKLAAPAVVALDQDADHVSTVFGVEHA